MTAAHTQGKLHVVTERTRLNQGFSIRAVDGAALVAETVEDHAAVDGLRNAERLVLCWNRYDELVEENAWLKVKPEWDRISAEMVHMEKQMLASDQPEAADRRTPAQLKERYAWSALYIAKREQLAEIRGAHYKAMDRIAIAERETKDD